MKTAQATPIRLGLRENLAQFSLLVAVNALVGGMVGQERTVVPLLAEQTFGLTAFSAGTPLAGNESRRPDAGRGMPSMGKVTSRAMRLSATATPGSALSLPTSDSGARSTEAKTWAKR